MLMVTQKPFLKYSNNFKKSLLLWCISLVVDFVLLGRTNSLLVIYSVFRQILPRKMLFAPHHLHRDKSFPIEHSRDNLAYQ